ncbi:MAG TPA: GNAT family protein [Pseudonocardiaceae bacterium]|jgi:RimJ/RimL family protein N-acetyltransferase|nr:GNAT family protein [Pseudonocardiaceae bacterium]
MLRGEKVGLRARHEADVPILHAELHDDVATRSRGGRRPWRPISPGDLSPFAVSASPEDVARFSVVELADTAPDGPTIGDPIGELAGEATLWGIDTHNRSAHLGIALRPGHRGRGLGADTVNVLCGYGFTIRGLNRLQVDTLADNTAMINAAVRVGFLVEGTLRRAAWVSGEFLDEVVLGLLAAEWAAS